MQIKPRTNKRLYKEVLSSLTNHQFGCRFCHYPPGLTFETREQLREHEYSKHNEDLPCNCECHNRDNTISCSKCQINHGKTMLALFEAHGF